MFHDSVFDGSCTYFALHLLSVQELRYTTFLVLQLKNSVSGGRVMGNLNLGFVPSVKHLVSSRLQMVHFGLHLLMGFL